MSSPLALEDALRMCERLAALAVLLSSLELLRMRRALDERGVFRWSVLRREFSRAPGLVRALLDAALSYRGFVLLLWLQLLGAAALGARAHGALAPLLFVCTLLVCVRFRGTFNGGSDAMLLAVLLGVSLARASDSSTLQLASLAYVAAQLVLSYFVAGIAKLRQPTWRDGRALLAMVRLRPYAAPPWATRMLSHRMLAVAASWWVIAFECAFPLALTGPTSAQILLSAALGFHLANVAILGLNRFFWAWLAAYPALLFFANAT
jgi:hypothetical protein